jgi:hypothetical protein
MSSNSRRDGSGGGAPPVRRRDFVAGVLALALAMPGQRAAVAAGKPIVQVHKSPT